MNNRQVLSPADEPVQERYPNRFRKGQSGNPGGRPRKTASELKAVEKMKKLTPEAVDVVLGILRNEKASFYARLQAAEIIFNRAMGRPETYLKVDNAEQTVEASVARLRSLFEGAQEDEGVSMPPDVSDADEPAMPDDGFCEEQSMEENGVNAHAAG